MNQLTFVPRSTAKPSLGNMEVMVFDPILGASSTAIFPDARSPAASAAPMPAGMPIEEMAEATIFSAQEASETPQYISISEDVTIRRNSLSSGMPRTQKEPAFVPREKNRLFPYLSENLRSVIIRVEYIT